MSFTRKGAAAPAAQAPGTRPGPAGSTLVSTGIPGVDTLLGGGAPLGRLLLISVGGAEVGGAACSSPSPSPSPDTGAGGASVADLLTRCFLAEGVARGQPCLWVQALEGVEEGAAALPPASSPWWLPAPRAAGRADRPEGTSRPGSGAADGGGELRIAWQYRQYLGPGAGGVEGGGGGTRKASPASTTRPAPARGAEKGWAADHDLGTKAAPPGDAHLFRCVRAGPGTVAEVVAFIRGAPAADGAAAGAATRPPPARVVLSLLGSPAWRGATTASADPDAPAAWEELLGSLRLLRGALRGGGGGGGGGAPVALLIHAPARAFPTSATLARAAAAADGLLALDALRSDAGLAALLPDPGAVVGLARAVRLPGAGLGGLARPPRGPSSSGGGSGAAAPPSPTAPPPAAVGSAALHVLRLKRGRLSLVAADVDPDAEEALGGGGGGGGGGAVSACAAGPAGGRAAAALEF